MLGAEKVFQGSKVEGIGRREKEEEEKRGNKAEALLNHDRDHSLLRFLVRGLRGTVG